MSDPGISPFRVRKGVLLPQFFNMEHKFSETTSYYKAWFMASGYKRPSRRTSSVYAACRMIFEGVMGTVIVVTVHRKFQMVPTCLRIMIIQKSRSSGKY